MLALAGTFACFVGATGADTAPAAAPSALAVNASASALRQPSAAETAAYRRCRWRDGRRHCRWYGGRGYRSYEARPNVERQPEYDSRKLPWGSKLWWEQIERESGDRR
jgi:hypothetical protein